MRLFEQGAFLDLVEGELVEQALEPDPDGSGESYVDLIFNGMTPDVVIGMYGRR